MARKTIPNEEEPNRTKTCIQLLHGSVCGTNKLKTLNTNSSSGERKTAKKPSNCPVVRALIWNGRERQKKSTIFSFLAKEKASCVFGCYFVYKQIHRKKK